jgi:hypothetical protein
MMPSRGMGNINPSKMPKRRVVVRKDDPNKVELFSKGGLYENIHKKQARIAAGSKEKMRKPGSKGAPTNQDFINSAKTAKK